MNEENGIIYVKGSAERVAGRLTELYGNLGLSQEVQLDPVTKEILENESSVDSTVEKIIAINKAKMVSILAVMQIREKGAVHPDHTQALVIGYKDKPYSEIKPTTRDGIITPETLENIGLTITTPY